MDFNKEEIMNDKVKELKAQVFDIIVAQENLKGQFSQLEEVKQEKLKELKAALDETRQSQEQKEVNKEGE